MDSQLLSLQYKNYDGYLKRLVTFIWSREPFKQKKKEIQFIISNLLTTGAGLYGITYLYSTKDFMNIL